MIGKVDDAIPMLYDFGTARSQVIGDDSKHEPIAMSSLVED